MNSLSLLNKQQKEAVTSLDGPVMILAGAGSGKTRVISERISYLIEKKGVLPKHILAVTFTNKAASEMNTRIRKILLVKNIGIHISTFHSLAVSLLRKAIHLLGYSSNFIIYDTKDQHALIKNIIEDLNSKHLLTLDSKLIHHEICQAKSIAKNAEEILIQRFVSQKDIIKKIFIEYQQIMKGCNALDFEDILILTLKLFDEQPQFMESITARYRYIMVDEYQDTNFVQYSLLRYLTKNHKNLCVVGDDDQSIYGWRGAEIKNMLNFEKDFPDVKYISLEQNYRSTKKILEAANQVISSNTQRMPKKLWSQGKDGEKINWFMGENEIDEVEFVIRQIRKKILKYGRKFYDHAILYRSNYQSRLVEETLIEAKIPYRIIGSTSFYDREEIRDVIAYLKVIYNVSDELSLQRIINVPRRGIGKNSIIKANSISKERDIPFYRVICNARDYKTIPRSSAITMETFSEIIENYRKRFSSEPLANVTKSLLDEIGYLSYLETQKIDLKTRERRITNVNEFLMSIKNFAQQNINANLQSFLERISFFSDSDKNSKNNENFLSIMTLHSAKGLEFSYVYMIGMSEGIFPNNRSIAEMGEDEERRLCYVGITRAKEELTFSMAKYRKRYGEKIKQYPSRFLFSIKPELFSVPIIGEIDKITKEEKIRESRATFFSQIRKLEKKENG